MISIECAAITMIAEAYDRILIRTRHFLSNVAWALCLLDPLVVAALSRER